MAVPTESQLNAATLIPARHPLDPLTPEEIAEGLYAQKFKKFSIEIEKVSGKRLTLKLERNAKPAKKS